MNVEGVIRRVDRAQQGNGPVGFVFGVVKKFGDDRGSTLAALFAYYGFLAIFPLLLLLVTVIGFVLHNRPALQARVLSSAVAQLPVVGTQLGENIHTLRGHGVGVVFALLGLVWGSLGLAQIGQHAMAQVWNVPGVDRPGFVPRLGRSFGLLGVLGSGVLVTTVLAGAGGGRSSFHALLRIAVVVASGALNVGLFIAAFRILTPKQVPTRPLVPGAVGAGVGWSMLQTLGGYLVAHQLRHASQVYGLFGVVLGLFSFLSLAGTITLYAAEANVVWHRRLWPRSILQPPLTPSDKRVLADIAEQEERRPEQHIEVTYPDA